MTDGAAAPTLQVVPPQAERGGWYSPTRHGPSVTLLAGAVALGACALLAWLAFGIDAFHSHASTKPVTRTLRIDDSGQLRLPDGRTQAAKPYRATRGLRYAVTRTDVAMPDDAARLLIRLELPAGVEPRDAVLRARTPAAVVRLRRSGDDEVPYVDVTRVRRGDVSVDVLVALPAEGLLVDEPDDAPKLASATKPYDENVVEEARSGRRLAQLHRRAGWLVTGALVLGMLLPIGLLIATRRRWYLGAPKPKLGGAAPAGPPDSKLAIEAAAITRGARGVGIPDAFAAHVLELVARDDVKLRHTMDPRTGEGSVLGIGTALSDAPEDAPDASTLDGAALRLLAAVANRERDTVQLPDSERHVVEQIRSLGTDLDTARTTWRIALERELGAYGVVEHVRIRTLAIITAAFGVVLVASVLIALISTLDGTSVTAWFIAAATLAPTILLGAIVREQRGWIRVRPGRQAERLRWVAWRDALVATAASGTGAADLRVLPYAVAIKQHEGIAPRRAGPTDVGLAAATPVLIANLRRIAGATS